jgi:hypothetical protein
VTRATAFAARLLLIALGILLFVAVGEAALRVVYRDGGERTLGGPGGKAFHHDTIDGMHRGRRDYGQRRPGMPRVMILGDSITYGLGVRDWAATWPERLAQRFERDGKTHEFVVLAIPGNDMPQHLDAMRGNIDQVQPDVLIYQWYVNDIEAISHRPDVQPAWQRWPAHEWLRKTSYLYFVLDHRLAQLISRPHASYIEYLRSDFVPGTVEWTEFEREFHEFALLGTQAPRRLLLLYPQVPFRGDYPLRPLHDRMRTLAGAHALHIPPAAWTRVGGTIVASPDAPWGQSVRALTDSSGLTIATKDYLFKSGPVVLNVTFRGEGGRLDLIDPASGTPLAGVDLPSHDGAPRESPARVVLPGDRVRRLAIRVSFPGGSEAVVSNLRFDVDYSFEVIDLADTLNTFNTHASAFDAHPNARTHQVIADVVYAALTASR